MPEKPVRTSLLFVIGIITFTPDATAQSSHLRVGEQVRVSNVAEVMEVGRVRYTNETFVGQFLESHGDTVGLSQGDDPGVELVITDESTIERRGTVQATGRGAAIGIMTGVVVGAVLAWRTASFQAGPPAWEIFSPAEEVLLGSAAMGLVGTVAGLVVGRFIEIEGWVPAELPVPLVGPPPRGGAWAASLTWSLHHD